MAAPAEGDEHIQNNNEETLQLSFPVPPSKYFKKYRDADIKCGTSPLPPKVISGAYSTFGDAFEENEEIIRPLEIQGIPRLYSIEDDFDILSEMKKINHSILVNFMELLDTLVESNSQHERELKLEDMNLLFINLHHLINEFRPHQFELSVLLSKYDSEDKIDPKARETLRIMLQRQKAQKHETVEKLNRHIEKTRAILRNCQSTVAAKSSTVFKQINQPSQQLAPSQEVDNQIGKEVSRKVDLRFMCELVDQLM